MHPPGGRGLSGGAWDKKNLPLRFHGLPVDLSPVADLQDEDDELAVPKVADEPVVPHAVTPIP